MLKGGPSWVWAEGNSVESADAFGAPTHTHTLWCSPITLDLLWRAHSSLCMVLSSSSRGSCVLLQTPCHHRASSIKVAALWSQLCHWASKTGPFWGAFAVYCDKVVLSQTKYTVQGTQCTVGNPFTEKTIVLRAKGRPWENNCSIWELAPNAGALNQWISHFVCECVKMTRMHGCVKEESQRERLFNSPDRIPWITPFCF